MPLGSELRRDGPPSTCAERVVTRNKGRLRKGGDTATVIITFMDINRDGAKDERERVMGEYKRGAQVYGMGIGGIKITKR